MIDAREFHLFSSGALDTDLRVGRTSAYLLVVGGVASEEDAIV